MGADYITNAWYDIREIKNHGDLDFGQKVWISPFVFADAGMATRFDSLTDQVPFLYAYIHPSVCSNDVDFLVVYTWE